MGAGFLFGDLMGGRGHVVPSSIGFATHIGLQGAFRHLLRRCSDGFANADEGIYEHTDQRLRKLSLLTALLLAATTGLSVPSLIDGIGPNDYPTWAIKDEVSGGGVIHAVIDPSGRIAECAVISEIGNSKLAKSLCSILARKRYRPATLRDGRKVHGILDSMVNLWLPDTDEGRKIGAMRQGADAELAVSQLPASEQSDVTVLLAYDAKGKIADCAPVREAKSPTLAKLACDHGAIFDNVVQRDKSGHAVPYVTRKTIRLILSTPQK